MKTNLNESSRFQLIRTEKTTEKRLLTSSNGATIVCTNEEQHKLAAQNRAFSLTWPASMQIYRDKRMRLHKKRIQLPKDFLGTPTWLPFHCFGTPIWPP